MGSALCTFFKQKPVKVLFFGLDAVGKTTLLYKMKLGEVVVTIPTIGFIVEEVSVNGINMFMWDVGLRGKSRPMIRHYTAHTDTIIFMVDSSDHDRLTEAVDDFFSFLGDAVEERQLPVLVLANKQDNPKVMSPEEIKNAIYKRGGEAFKRNTAMEVFPTVALTLEGMTPALEWLKSQLALKMAHESYSPYTALWSKATHFPASVMKSTYHRVVGLFSASDDEKKNLNEEPVIGQ